MRLGLVRLEPVRWEPARMDSVRVEAVLVEVVREEADQVQADRVEAVRVQVFRSRLLERAGQLGCSMASVLGCSKVFVLGCSGCLQLQNLDQHQPVRCQMWPPLEVASIRGGQLLAHCQLERLVQLQRHQEFGLDRQLFVAVQW